MPFDSKNASYAKIGFHFRSSVAEIFHFSSHLTEIPVPLYKKNRCFGSGEPPLVQNANVAERVLKRFDYPKLPKLQCFDVAVRGAKKLEEPKSLTYGATRLPRAPIKCIAPIYDVAKLRCCEVANLELLPLSFTSRL